MFDQRHYWQSPYVEWAREVPEQYDLYVFHVRPSRSRAMAAAVVEALSLFRSYHPVAPLNGPLPNARGVFRVALPASAAACCIPLMPLLGYSRAVDHVVPLSRDAGERTPRGGARYELRRIYSEDSASFRQRAPDRRVFLLTAESGGVRAVKGYRGGSDPLNRRGLPVEDARLLVNLAAPRSHLTSADVFLDPFAGAGGLVVEAVERNYRVLSVDLDRRLRYGLQKLGACHVIGDAGTLPFADGSVAAIASEPPYASEAAAAVVQALEEMARVLQAGGRMALLVAEHQVPALLDAAAAYRLKLFLASRIDRKGLRVVVLAWEKAGHI